MAEQQKPPFEYDDWVGAVRPDPRNTDKLTLVQGFIGQSSEAGHIRVYSDESLNSFVEVPESAIVYAQKLSATESSLGGSKLWLRSDSVVTFGDPKSANRPKSTFLEGDIMHQYAAFGGQPDTTQMVGMMGGQGDTTGQFMAGQGDTTGPGAQAMASTPVVFCGPPVLVSVIRICRTQQIGRTVCQIFSCLRTVCGLQTCRQSLCGPRSCIPILCGIGGGGGFVTAGACPSIACGPGGIGGGNGPIVNPGFMPMGGQPDTTQMGGYYGTFNPYMY